MPETIKLPGLNTKRLWKISIVDNLDKPTVRVSLLIRRCDTAFAAMTDIRKSEGWGLFAERYPTCEIAAVELAGILEN